MSRPSVTPPNASSVTPPTGTATACGAAAARGRPRDLDKHLAVLQAAQELFSRDGLEGTSMEAIARRAGVSKVTLYNHFGDKDTLFGQAVAQVCRNHMPEAHYAFAPGHDLRARFLLIAEGFFDLVIGPVSMDLCRLMAGNPERHRKLSALFWQAGPEKVIALLAGMLSAVDQTGELRVADPVMAASQFFCLIKGHYHLQLLVGAADRIEAAERRRHLESAVDVFLAAYRPPR